ncbi:cysteine desulfurase [Desulfatibacillum alkenivorans DSM 16219]|uniref:cysteine desulfurase n=1 Tax=Desulfatibacillum alkenivorans DSM 16219 TaxID=1121393 RepID=A0A1M6C478_9BACT|nr:cysteine desulfurase family protein [Desulfatibacillum alkenivorans]SHI55830.1 cysteine desulfurase [Desulfatibacillum alkenivorans DSM 16219]
MIYLDHNATTAVDERVARVMEPFFRSAFGNPSSSYQEGLDAKRSVENAREKAAKALGAKPQEIVFTSGGSESNNWVIKSLAGSRPGKGHIITTAIEHPSVLNPCLYFMERGYDVTFAGVDSQGVVDVEEIEKAVRPDTFLISVMHANNETGVIQPISEISRIAKKAGALLHSDAAQTLGKIPVDVNAMGVDFLSVAGHKVYAPKGIGLLYIREGVELEPMILGGGQESGRRAGTENVPMAVGLGTACEFFTGDMTRVTERLSRLTALLFELLSERIEGLVLNGHPDQRLPNCLSVSFPVVTGADLLAAVPEVRASTGAACHDRSAAVSHVLAAMGVPAEQAKGTVRLSLGIHTNQTEIEKAAKLIANAYEKMTRP